MNLNLGSVSGSNLNLGYTGAYTGTVYPSVTMVSPILDDPASVAYQTTHPVAANDIFEWQDPNSLGVSVDSSGLITANEEGGFLGRWFDDGDQVYGDWETYTFAVPVADTIPAAFTVAPLTNQPLNQYVEFAPITVADIDAGQSIAVQVTNAQYAVDSGSGYGGFTATSTDVQLGDLVKPRILTSDIGSTEVTGSISIGSESSSLSATTQAAVPQGVLTVGAWTVTATTAEASVSYNKSDATAYEYTLDGSTWTEFTPPLSLTSLPSGQLQNGQVRAKNATGSGEAADFTFETSQAEPAPQYMPVIGEITKTSNSGSVPFTYPAQDATGYEHSVDGGQTWETVTSPISRINLADNNTYSGWIRAVNDNGPGNYVAYSFVISSAPTPQGFAVGRNKRVQFSMGVGL
jgi:hypothetical protein